ncbi:MAG: hypothetical protein HUU02_01745 [Bacteroidetes bacterium]|nr:hypothetical protein [Bacteroidota bacterium]
MKKLLLLLVTVSMLGVFGCKEEEETVVTPTAKDPIVGTWLSEGANLAPGFYAFKYKKISATFNENKSYTVVATDSANTNYTFTGTYSATASAYTDTVSGSNTKGSVIYNIVLTQSTPNAVTSNGIYAVTSTALRYEVIQTTPALTDFGAPTAQKGFGSTTYKTFPLGATWIQKYVKQ